MGVLSLDRGAFVKEQHTEDRFGDHVQSPLFSREHFLEGKQLSFESHFLHEGVYDFSVGLKRKPVLVVGLLHFCSAVIDFLFIYMFDVIKDLFYYKFKDLGWSDSFS